jgi:flagellar motility protein MotE (MotC chaperone)
MAIPKAYQAKSQHMKTPTHQMVNRDHLNVPIDTYAPLGEQTRNPSLHQTKATSLYRYTDLKLTQKRRYIWLGIMCAICILIGKVAIIIDKWEHNNYPNKSFFTFSVGKKTRAAESSSEKKDTPDQNKTDISTGATPDSTHQPSLSTTAKDEKAIKPVQKNVDETPIKFDPLAISSEKEIEYLSKLAARRAELDKREALLLEREKALEITAKKQKEKNEDLKKLKESIEAALGKTDKAQTDRFSKLIKIYEGMKPKSAAQIFDRMDISILKEITPLMNQRKISTIMEQMNVVKAKELSLALANDRNPFAHTKNENANTKKK